MNFWKLHVISQRNCMENCYNMKTIDFMFMAVGIQNLILLRDEKTLLFG